MRRESGFSLVEVMVATAILLIGLLAIVGQWPAGTKAVIQGQFQTEASVIAQRIMEDLGTKDYPGIASGNLVEGRYTVAWSVVAGPIANCKTAEVTVSWNWLGENHGVKMATIFSAKY